ncbi:DUF3288 family protein [Laspinema sp. A4]|uniref:DUF3288 family protein n=1 Tax=Laspinema sp. D2d TaxID=2953686 RepID=UPI0021BB918C|nr:DUF3288 family protein [Laspinema sp. D2d]MCT7982336.1 DUF3288 family protein [Laspinema sp. D2d]
MSEIKQEQQHPQARKDRETLDKILMGELTEYNLAELARLRIRYRGFPGSRDVWSDIEKVLSRWNMTEEDLFEKTREIHRKGRVYRAQDSDSEDWM